MKIKRLLPSDDFIPETFNEFEMRYSGFGKDIYVIMKEQSPTIFQGLLFQKRLSFQTEDSYAEYSSGEKPFVIQLDPLCGVIVLWNEQKQIEIGNWSINEYDEAIAFIKSELI